MERITQTKKAMKKENKIVDDPLKWLSFEEYFPQEINDFRKQFRQELEQKVAPIIGEYIEKAEFPEKIVPIFKSLNLGYHYMKTPFGKGKCLKSLFAILMEFARIDASVGTLYVVNYILFGNTIDDYGSEEQRSYFLPKLNSCEIMGGWGLTEREVGSDASSLTTSCKKLPNGDWEINGNKRWIGNGNRDFMVVFARDVETGLVNGFIVDLTLPGIKRENIKHKLALRAVQNVDIEFKNLIVKGNMRLPKVNGFENVAEMLAHSRLAVCFAAVGLGVGVYENTIRYLNNRKQFGKKLLGFQLVQEKLVRMMGNIQASLFLVSKLTDLVIQKKITIGKLAMGKAWVTLRMREVAALGREMLGGNGIIFDNYVMKAMADMEAVFTYEGTYDINCLVTGRELTGLAAFK